MQTCSTKYNEKSCKPNDNSKLNVCILFNYRSVRVIELYLIIIWAYLLTQADIIQCLRNYLAGHKGKQSNKVKRCAAYAVTKAGAQRHIAKVKKAERVIAIYWLLWCLRNKRHHAYRIRAFVASVFYY